MKRITLTLVSLMALLVLVGCGVNEEKLKEAQKRHNALEEQGLPDRNLTAISTQLHKAKSDLKRKRGSEANRAYKKALKALAAADSVMENSLTELKPKVTNRYLNLKKDVEENLTGLHLKEGIKLIDSILVPLEKDWIFLAEKKVKSSESRVEELKKMQDTAKTLMKKVPGTWTMTDTAYNSVDPSVNAVSKKVFIFKKDGSALFVDSKKGKEAPTLKQDFKFTSYGTWELKGSEVWILVNRIVGKEHVIEIINQNLDGSVKNIDKSKSVPGFDSSYTDDSQNRHINFEILEEDFTYRR